MIRTVKNSRRKELEKGRVARKIYSKNVI